MPSMLNRFDATPGDDGQIYFDDGERDTISVLRDGVRVLEPVKASKEEQQQVYVEALKRELEGVEHNLLHLGGPLLAWQEPPTREQLERQRTSLENTRVTIVAELARLDPETNGRKRRS